MTDHPDRIGADHIRLPSTLDVIGPLRRRGWKTVPDTGQSVIRSREGGRADWTPPPAAPASVVFPEP
ncbi:MAG TPA: hypothetical protein VNK41_09945 [Vicinamibacterales bacterium]|nr:hypothetical protein [Vicinamibacterales bacterium]